jgi:hypothetical protein
MSVKTPVCIIQNRICFSLNETTELKKRHFIYIYIYIYIYILKYIGVLFKRVDALNFTICITYNYLESPGIFDFETSGR